MNYLSKKINSSPKSPGVYIFKSGRRIIYIGKAAVLRTRLQDHLRGGLPATSVSWIRTDSVIEALILEANLIKKYLPKLNVKLRDDKSFAYIIITKEDFPRVYLSRPRSEKIPAGAEIYGPYLSAKTAQQALDIIRKLFPFRDCQAAKFAIARKRNRPCLFYAINRCLAPCLSIIDQKKAKKEYQNLIKQVCWFLQGKKGRIILDLKKSMKEASKKKQYEKAARIRDQIENLQHIKDIALIIDEKPALQQKFQRIEAYDISNIGKKFVVGAMVTMIDGEPAKNWYRKFKIRSFAGQDDVLALKEILLRRFNHLDWPKPSLIVIDGGLGQKRAAETILRRFKEKIRVISIAKRPSGDAILGKIGDFDKRTIFQARNEAHRFALNYHKLLRSKGFIQKRAK